jgi:hypothetical protein
MDDLPEIPGPDATYEFIDGRWVEIIDVTHLVSAAPVKIICSPVPGPNGTIRYVQDWIDLTHFG